VAEMCPRRKKRWYTTIPKKWAKKRWYIRILIWIVAEMCPNHKMATIGASKNVELFFKNPHKIDFYHVFESCFRAKMWKNSPKTRIKLIFTTFSTFYFLLRVAPKSLIYKGKTLSHTFPHFSKTFRLQKLVKSFLPLKRWN